MSQKSVKHESYLDCPLPDIGEKGQKYICDCGRVWRFDGRYFIMEGLAGEADDGLGVSVE